MKKLVFISILFFSFLGNAQLLLGAVKGQQEKTKRNNVPIPLEPTSTRFIFMGDSWTQSMYYTDASTKAAIEAAYPGESVTAHNHGASGFTITAYGDTVDSVLANYDYDPYIDTYCVIMLGVNDARLTAYSETTEIGRANRTNALIYMIDAIEAKGFTAILLDAPFTQFDGTFVPNPARPSYENEANGTKPYNDNIIIPIILSRTPEFAYEDGQSFMQPYVFFYNNYPEYHSTDGIHPNGTGYSNGRAHFINTICKYIFTGVPPTKIEKE